MCPVFWRLAAAPDLRPAMLQSWGRRRGRRRPHGFLFARYERGGSRFVVSHPSLEKSDGWGTGHLRRVRHRGLTGCGKARESGWFGGRHPAGAEALVLLLALLARLKSCPFKTSSFSAGAKAHADLIAFAARLKSCPFKAMSFSATSKALLILRYLRHD